MEKDLSEVQRIAGAIGLAELSLAREIKELVGSVTVTRKEFMDPKEVIK